MPAARPCRGHGLPTARGDPSTTETPWASGGRRVRGDRRLHDPDCPRDRSCGSIPIPGVGLSRGLSFLQHGDRLLPRSLGGRIASEHGRQLLDAIGDRSGGVIVVRVRPRIGLLADDPLTAGEAGDLGQVGDADDLVVPAQAPPASCRAPRRAGHRRRCRSRRGPGSRPGPCTPARSWPPASTAKARRRRRSCEAAGALLPDWAGRASRRGRLPTRGRRRRRVVAQFSGLDLDGEPGLLQTQRLEPGLDRPREVPGRLSPRGRERGRSRLMARNAAARGSPGAPGLPRPRDQLRELGLGLDQPCRQFVGAQMEPGGQPPVESPAELRPPRAAAGSSSHLCPSSRRP